MKDSRKTVMRLLAAVRDEDMEDLLWIIRQYAVKKLNVEEKKEVAA